ncbi:helix-turn-helix domain-containing protein [Loktanella sp. F6476L]|uniref:XRE family transcriptional regulator n=1 Tax=Loktanella sp. F6476L TaxID=2926405 RepID=UPI001FF6C2B5|nr:XRE family transcriptional regulator [Loktanella sp. F6476L]MCK0119498.1 helix-turn-helix domain-containing protein [Loktanella sp. F6476L]
MYWRNRLAAHAMTGSRIRERRLDQGMRQADVADAAGISASYLNLIEHNKRRIGGKLLQSLARALNADPASLSEGAEPAVLNGMRAAAARTSQPIETDRAEDLATRFPGWAGLIAAQEARVDTLEAEVRVLRDRMTHDPALAGALHNVITAVTSIRATAGILANDDNIDADWQRRFHVNIHDDSRRLAVESEALVAYLEPPTEAASSREHLTGFEEVEAFLLRENKLLDWVEAHPNAAPETLLRDYDAPALSREGREVLLQYLVRFSKDVRLMPRATFVPAAVAAHGDPSTLAAQFDADLPAVLRRLGGLPADVGLPPMGLAIADQTGALTYLKTVPGFAPSRFTAGCPLWPLYAALTQPMRPIKSEVVLPGQAGARFMCYAIAVPKTHADFSAAPVLETTMLVVSDPAPGLQEPIKAGVSCRVCPRSGCAARREPSAIEVKS